MHTSLKIISGGQTGADRGALEAAQEIGIPIGGWCPPNREAEDGKIPIKFDLIETPCERSKNASHIPRSLRTQWNVRDAEVTLILLSDTKHIDPGTQWTIDCCKYLKKEYIILNPFEEESVNSLQNWLKKQQPTVLNVAGPPESKAFGIQKATKEMFHLLFKV